MDSEELEIASSMVKPVYGLSFFNIGYHGIYYSIVFDYIDPLGYYKKISEDLSMLYDEINNLYGNMQKALDEEIVKINGRKYRSRVINVDIGFRSDYRYPYIVFNIAVDCKLSRGRNVYENIYRDTVAEYPYVSYWIFPNGSEILDVDISGDVFINKNILGVRVMKGYSIRGYERIVFALP